MDPNRPSPRRELQGPRPSPLKVRKESHKVNKRPPIPPQHRPPVIIYTVSPKVIHTNPSEFRSLVQRLTGSSSSSSSSNTNLAAAIDQHQMAPTQIAPSNYNDVLLEQLGIDHSGAVPTGLNRTGILSPVPTSIPAISPNFFSPPVLDTNTSLSFLHELSPASFNIGGNNGGYADNTFLVSPGNLLSTSILPSPGAYWDLFNQYHQNM